MILRHGCFRGSLAIHLRQEGPVTTSLYGLLKKGMQISCRKKEDTKENFRAAQNKGVRHHKTLRTLLAMILVIKSIKFNCHVSFHQFRFCAANAFICIIFYTASLQVHPTAKQRVFKTTPSNSSTEDDPHGSSRDSRHQFLQAILRFQVHLTTCNSTYFCQTFTTPKMHGTSNDTAIQHAQVFCFSFKK